MMLTKLEDAEGNEHMFEITGQWALCLGQSSQCKQQLPLVLLPLTPYHDLPPALLPCVV